MGEHGLFRSHQPHVADAGLAVHKEDVFGFDVAVEEAGCVDDGQPFKDVACDPDERERRNPPGTEAVRERIRHVGVAVEHGVVRHVHGVEEVLLILADVVDLQQFRTVFSEGTVIGDAFKFALPLLAELLFRDDLDCEDLAG